MAQMVCLLVTPYYNKATQAGLIGHYTAVAKEAKAPIIHVQRCKQNRMQY